MSRVCVITGASAGLGAELARQLAATGRYSLLLAARRAEELAKVANECGPSAKTLVADVTKRAEVEGILQAAIREFGRCDIWVNNVGRGISKSVLEITDDEIDAVILVNLKSAIYGSQIAANHFKVAGSGHIVNVSSFLGKAPVAPIRSIYSASKAALNSLTSNLRMELLSSGIHVTTVPPSPPCLRSRQFSAEICRDERQVLPGVIHTDFAANAINGTPHAAPMPGQTAQVPEPNGARNPPDGDLCSLELISSTKALISTTAAQQQRNSPCDVSQLAFPPTHTHPRAPTQPRWRPSQCRARFER